jgi:APA family basic amino acid/polyamine antiporter
VAVRLYERVFGVVPSTSFVVGTVVGTGIYLKPGVVASLVNQPRQLYLVWLLGGLFATAGATVYIDLAKNWPSNGGPFLYLRTTYGPWAASLLLAADIFLARPAAVGALATGLGLVWQLPPGLSLGLAITTVLGLSTIQLLGARVQGWSQTALTLLQLLPLMAIVAVFPVLGGEVESHDWSAPAGQVQWAAAFLAVLWAYDGWYNITILGGEVKRPERTLRWALVGGMTFVTGLYLILNMILVHQVGRQRLMEEGIGLLLLLSDWNLAWLGTATQLALTLAMLATLNGTLACGARMIVAGAENGLLSRAVSSEPTAPRPTLSFALWCAGLLLLFAGLPLQRNLFDSLTEFTAVVVAVLSALTVTCIFHGHLFAVKPSRGVMAAAIGYLSIALVLLYFLVLESHWLALSGVVTVGVVGTFLWLRRQTVPFSPRGD